MNETAEARGTTPVAHPSFAETVRVFARIGLLSFGGPAGQIALMHRILVEEKRWVSEERFLHALNYCMLLPGPEAQQLATYTGWLLHGTRGGVIAGTLFVLPGFFVLMALSIIYALFNQTQIVAALFFGLKAAVLAIVVEALLRVGRRAIRNRLMLAIAALAFVALFVFAVPFPMVVIGAGLAGLVGTRVRPEAFAPTTGAAVARPSLELKDPPVPHTLASALGVALTWGALWAAPVVALTAIFGPQSVFAPIAGFFSLMAVVTFGGAYAVLAYVAQEAVQGFGWLQPGEMLDGLAMAETTPGPLILVLTFVGFLAAFRTPPVGLDPLLSGIIGGTLTTWVTFVPCFLWIFLGAPYVEALRANRALSGALSAITAAVVGVILNLALWFGLHVLFGQVDTLSAGPIKMPLPDFMSTDLWAAALALAAGLALFRFKLGMLATLALCAGLGIAIRLTAGG